MSKLTTVLLWVAALAVAAWVIARARRGDRVLLRGRWSPRLVRMVAVLIVAFGWRPAEAAPPDACATMPTPVSTPLTKAHVKPPLLKLDVTLDDIASPEIGARAQHLFLEARTAAPAALVDVLARAHRYARMAEARIKTIAEVGAPEFRPWMSKAARPSDVPRYIVTDEYRAVFRKHLETATAGTWESEATVDVTIAGQGELVRAGVATSLKDGAVLRFGRLDLVRAKTDLTLKHAALGDIVVPAGQVVGAWTLPTLLPAAGRAYIAAQVAAALQCDVGALRVLEQMLPAAHEALRAAVAGPAQPGTAALKLVLALYDE